MREMVFQNMFALIKIGIFLMVSHGSLIKQGSLIQGESIKWYH